MINYLQQGLLFVLSAPAGTGKTTLVQQLLGRIPHMMESVSFTTRPPRPQEREGEHYHFIDSTAFTSKIASGDFLEYAKVYGHFYGTSRQWVDVQRAAGKHVILVIDTQGAAKLMEQQLDAIYLFLLPPSQKALRQRLESRGTETQAVIEERLSWAERELARAQNYDYLVINDSLSTACDALYSIIVAEEHRTEHLKLNNNFPAALKALLSNEE
jgi:guanylate kinase